MSAMMPIVKKVEGLIALAGADGPEGLTAGKLACKIIRERGLHVVADVPREIFPDFHQDGQAIRDGRAGQHRVVQAGAGRASARATGNFCQLGEDESGADRYFGFCPASVGEEQPRLKGNAAGGRGALTRRDREP